MVDNNNSTSLIRHYAFQKLEIFENTSVRDFVMVQNLHMKLYS